MSNPENNPKDNPEHNPKNNPDQKSITAKIEDLDQKIEWFYGEDFSLDTATGKYKEAIALAKDIEKDLDTLKNEIEVLSKDFSK